MSTRDEGAGGYPEPTVRGPNGDLDRDPSRFDPQTYDPNRAAVGHPGNAAAPAPQPPAAGQSTGLPGLASFASMGNYTPTTSDNAAPVPASEPRQAPNGTDSYTHHDEPARQAPVREEAYERQPVAADQDDRWSSYQEPRFEEQSYEEPQREEPRFEEPRFAEPRLDEPRAEEPRFEEPRLEETRFSDAHFDQPRFVPPTNDDEQFEPSPAYEAMLNRTQEEPRFEAFDPDASEPSFPPESDAGYHREDASFDGPADEDAAFEPAGDPHGNQSEFDRLGSLSTRDLRRALAGGETEPAFAPEDYDRETDYEQQPSDGPDYAPSDTYAEAADYGREPASDATYQSRDEYAQSRDEYAQSRDEYAQPRDEYAADAGYDDDLDYGQEPVGDFAAYPDPVAAEDGPDGPPPDYLRADAGGDATGLQQFEARYDKHPEIPLRGYEQPEKAPEDAGERPFFRKKKKQNPDADFLADERHDYQPGEGKGRGRRTFMFVAVGLVGALALGGALAYAYKMSGIQIAGSETPPTIEADNRPVKMAPENPGGKEIPHQNKLIYDRLGGGESPEKEKIVSRQEDIVSQAESALAERQRKAAAADTETGTRSLAPGDQPAAAPTAPKADPTEGPRKVKTLVVRPDGTIVRQPDPAPVAAPVAPVAAPPAEATTPPAEAAPEGAPAAPLPKPRVAAGGVKRVEPEAAAETQVAALPPPVRKPKPPAGAPANPAPAATSDGGNYVVQVGARRSQTAALAGFADLQQKYPSILSGYRPIIQKADLGNKGVWYRLRIGPLESQSAASGLCKKLKSAGMRTCLVNTQ